LIEKVLFSPLSPAVSRHRLGEDRAAKSNWILALRLTDEARR